MSDHLILPGSGGSRSPDLLLVTGPEAGDSADDGDRGPGFEFGAALTATELEGCHPAADWSRWIASGRAPNSGRGSNRGEIDGSGGGLGIAGAGFTDSYREDLEQLAGLGARSVMITLEWAALQPHPARHDEDAVEFRRDVLRTAAEFGLQVWGCLVDGTLPGWFADDEGGFGDDRARSLLWPRHVDWIGETFGDLVHGWIPQREPAHWALRRNLTGAAPPGRRDVATATAAVRDAVLVDGEAWRLLRGTAPVATYQTARTIHYDPDDVKARPLAAGLERLLWHPWLSAIAEGALEVGNLPVREIEHLRGAFDRVVVELRPPIRVDGTGRWHAHPGDRSPGPTGWVAWPDALAEALHRTADELGDHEIVAAGNLADIVDDGRSRPDHQQALLELAADVAGPVVGWWQSSPIDGYHYEYGFDLRPGLIAADRSETAAAEKFREAAGRVGA